MKSKIFVVVAVGLCCLTQCGATRDFEPRRDDAFERGYYVPATAEEAAAELQSALSIQAKNALRSTLESQIAGRYHLTLGSWIRKHWLYPGSRLRDYFDSEGVQSRDEASSVIIKAVWRELNSQRMQVHDLLADAHSAEQAIRPPEDVDCPDHPGEKMETLCKLVTIEPTRVIHVARCSSTDDLWIFEVGRGWSRPDPELLAELSERISTECYMRQ